MNKFSKGNIGLILVIVVAAALLGGGFIYMQNKSKLSLKPSTTQLYNQATTPATTSTQVTGTSDADLDSDMNSINTKLNAAASEQTNIDAGLNQTAPNLGQ